MQSAFETIICNWHIDAAKMIHMKSYSDSNEDLIGFIAWSLPCRLAIIKQYGNGCSQQSESLYQSLAGQARKFG